MTFLLVGSLCLVGVSALATSRVNNDEYNVVNGESKVTYSSSKTIATRSNVECVTRCSSDHTCSAVVVSTIWTKDSAFCELLTNDRDKESNQNTKFLDSSEEIWMKQAPHAYSPQNFNETEQGCLMVDGTFTGSWDDARKECEALGAHVGLTEADTLQVKFCRISQE